MMHAEACMSKRGTFVAGSAKTGAFQRPLAYTYVASMP